MHVTKLLSLENRYANLYIASETRRQVRRASAGKDGNMTGTMTDKQMEVILNLVADKFAGCQSMEEVKKAIMEVRDMARKDRNERNESNEK